jgi:hypothetical protein
MKTEMQEARTIDDLEQSRSNETNWRMPVREQVHLHAALLRRRIQQGLENNERENTLVFIEGASDLGSLLFSQTAEYTPLSEPAE